MTLSRDPAHHCWCCGKTMAAEDAHDPKAHRAGYACARPDFRRSYETNADRVTLGKGLTCADPDGWEPTWDDFDLFGGA